MKSTKENLLAMAIASSTVCHQKESLVDGSTDFKMALAEVDHRIAAIQKFGQVQQLSAKRISIKRRRSRNAAVTAALTTLTGIIIYANATSNSRLIEQTERLKIKLNHNDEVLLERIMEILKLTHQHSDSLQAYGVGLLQLEDLETCITIFEGVIPEYRLQLARQKNVAAQVNALEIGLSDMFSFKLDLCVEQFKSSHPDFYKEYHKARIITEVMNTVSGVKGIAEDEASKIKLNNVKITILERGVKRKTSVQGNYMFKKLSPGKYTLKAEAKGYDAIIVQDVTVIPGQITDLDLKLKKNAA